MKESAAKFVIQGLAGEHKLAGSIAVKGAKNAALKAIAASILFDGPVTLENVPDTSDVHTISDILRKLGAKVQNGGPTVKIDPTTIHTSNIDPELAKSMRASNVLTGPLLARFKAVTFPSPGGCVIGARPIDQFLKGYKLMGADDSADKSDHISAPQGLSGAEIFFNVVSVGATETLMMAAVLADGTTTLKNCAMEPEIVSLAEWLNECGAKISGVGTSAITIVGRAGKLLSPKKPYVTIPDRIEAGSFLILGALCAKELTITDCRPDHMEAVIALLRDSGVDIKVGKNELKVTGGNKYKSFNVRTHEYPGFPTDLQSPLVTFLTQATGESIVVETIFDGRFKFTEDLMKMGANVKVMNPREIMVKGPTKLAALPDGEELRAHDIRAGFAVVLAALVGTGKFTVNNVGLIDRGYEKLEERLRAIGADVQRV